MCPPVSGRYWAEGVSHLYASWMYQLQHGGRVRMCFACFRTAFQELRAFLESEDWEDEDWDPELMDYTEEGSEQESPLGPGQGQPALAAGPVESEGVGLHHHFVPTELEPQDAAPLGLGAEAADWTQGLPWLLGRLPVCSHWPSPSPPRQGFLKADLPPGEPMVLKLGTTQAMDPAEARAWLLDLQVLYIVGCYDAVYLRKMKAAWALQTPGQCWELLLEPDEVWVVQYQDAPQKQELHRWKLSVLESSPSGEDEELVPADSALLKRGFTVLSYLPRAVREAEEGASASRPQSWPLGWDPIGGGGSSSGGGLWGPGEGLAVMGASALGELPRFQPLGPGPQN